MRQKGLVGIFVLILVLAIAVAGGAYYLGRVSTKLQPAKTQQQAQITPSPDPTANWKTFTNPTYQYLVKYPPNIPVDENRPDTVSFDNQIIITVSQQNPEECQGDGCRVILEKEDVKINNLNARKITGGVGEMGGNIPQHFISFVILYNDYYYEFTLWELKQVYSRPLPPPGSIVSKPIPKDKILLLDQMLSTFKLTS